LAPEGSVDRLTGLSVKGLSAMYVPDELTFVQTLRGVRGPDGPAMEAQGRNLRYAAISALGLSRLPQDRQSGVLSGATAAEVARVAAEHARADTDPGAVALAAWAQAEVASEADPVLFQRLARWLASGEPLPTVDIAWMVTAATAALGLVECGDVAAMGRDLLVAAQGPAGIFPHAVPAASLGRWRSHVGCFADQVYPVQALARHAAATGDRGVLAVANRGAAAICRVQGREGQWWWHYDVRDGSVVEGFPVYSVHQHAMAPMALLDLAESGGDDHLDELLLGLDWLRSHPETFGEVVDEERGVIWRKVGRREPSKAARKVAAVTTSLRAGLQVRGLDRVFPAGEVDHECRPYELGWLLYAWHSSPRVERLDDLHADDLPLRLVAPPQPGREHIFGMPIDAITMDQVVDRCDRAIRDQRPVQIGVLNAAKVVRLQSDERLRKSLLACEVIVADGQSVVWASRLLGKPLPERVAGIDLFESLVRLAHRDRRRVYLLGARPEVVAQVARTIERRFPGARVVGFRDGYFTDDEAESVAATIQASGADMLFLGMVSPKKEIFTGTYGPTLGVPVVHGVGGSFDVFAGVTQRAPVAWQRAGLEWAFRLKQEPRRLARRYLTTNSAFLAMTVRERFRPTPTYAASSPPDQALRRVS
jgi:exopolysaccharide biosynthesis WecB/TagA/CpsF family protein